MNAVRVHELGDVDVLRYEDIPIPAPGSGQALVKVEAIGLNFIDCCLRKGLYKTALPFIPGMEASGERSQPPVRTSPTFAWETGWPMRHTWAPMPNMSSCRRSAW